MPTLPEGQNQEVLLPEKKELDESSPPQVRLFKNQIILNPTISKLNFCALILFYCYPSISILPVGLLALPLLSVVYGLSNQEELTAVAIAQIMQFFLRMLISPWVGHFCDKYGRKSVIVVGVACMAVSIGLAPHLPSVYPYYILNQLIFDIGMTCILTPPIIADYIDYETKGRAAGLAIVISFIASFASTYFTEGTNLEHNIPSKYHQLAITGLVMGILLILLAKGGLYHKKLLRDRKADEAKRKLANISEQIIQDQSQSGPNNKVKDIADFGHKDSLDAVNSIRNSNSISLDPASGNETENTNLKPGFKAGILQVKDNPWLFAGYVCSFLSFANTILVSTTLVNYVTRLVGNETGATQAFDLINKHLLVGAVCAIFFGFFTDKYNKFKMVLFIMACAILSIILLVVAPSPYHALAYVSMVFFGIAAAGYMTFVIQVIGKYPNPKYRASVAAVSSMCAALGGSMISILGSVLSKINPVIPFYLYLGATLVGLLAIIILYSKKRHILSKI